MKPPNIDETLPTWHRLHISFTLGLGSSALGVVRDNPDVELALSRRIKEKKVGSQFKVNGLRPGGGLPICIRCRRIFFTSSGAVITASIFMGELHLTHSSGFKSYTFPAHFTKLLEIFMTDKTLYQDALNNLGKISRINGAETVAADIVQYFKR